MIAFILVDAKPRMDVENASTMLLTETLIRSLSVAAQKFGRPKGGAATCRRRTQKSSACLGVIGFTKCKPRRPPIRAPSNTLGFPDTKEVPLAPLRIPVEVRGDIIDTIVIMPKPSDEFSELLEAIFQIFQWGVIISTVTLPLDLVHYQSVFQPDPWTPRRDAPHGSTENSIFAFLKPDRPKSKAYAGASMISQPHCKKRDRTISG